MAISAGSEKLENTTMAQNSDFIIGKNKFEYREKKQQRLLVLIWNWWNKKKNYEENTSNRKEIQYH